MKIYGDLKSGNFLKVKYTADRLGLAYEWHPVDIMQGESRSAAFFAMNPAGQVPVLVLDDNRALAQSNAIIAYLAEGSDLVPSDPFDRAKLWEWLFWEQYSHEPTIAVCRFQMLYLGRPAAARDAEKVARGEQALALMEAHLSDRGYLVGEALSIADIALLAYSRLAPEGDFDLAPHAALRDWIARVEADLGLAKA